MKFRIFLILIVTASIVTPSFGQDSADEKEPTTLGSQQLPIWGNANSKVHFAGYGHAGYNQNLEGAKDGAFSTAFAPIFHYNYQDFVLLEAELDLGIDEDGTTKTEMEYAAINLILGDYVTIVAGKFLSPVGYFVQNLHPAWINKLPSAPVGFGHDEAAPISDLGVQLRGGIPISSARLNYALFVGNGPQFKAGHSAGEYELAQEAVGSNDKDDRKAGGGRIGIVPIPDLELGISGAYGETKLVATNGGPGRKYQVIGADIGYNSTLIKGLWLRGEFIQTKLGSVDSTFLSAASQTLTAWYGQISYRVWKLEPVFRYGQYIKDTGTETINSQFAIGLNYLFSANVIAKFAFQQSESGAGHGHSTGTGDQEEVHEKQVLAHLAFGF